MNTIHVKCAALSLIQNYFYNDTKNLGQTIDKNELINAPLVVKVLVQRQECAQNEPKATIRYPSGASCLAFLHLRERLQPEERRYSTLGGSGMEPFVLP